MPAVPVSLLADVPAKVLEQSDVIGIDEGSFLPDIVEFCEEQVVPATTPTSLPSQTHSPPPDAKHSFTE